MLASPLSHPRVGFIVPKYSRSGVERNRLKRQLREIVRTQLLMHLSGVDVVIKARANAYGVQFPVLADELRQTPAEVARLLP